MTSRKTNDGNLSPAPKRARVQRPGSPSCQSEKSNRSNDPPLQSKGESTADPRVQMERSASPVPSCQSMKSDRSIDPPLNFKGEFTGDQRVQMERSASPVPSCQSMKSDRSIDPPLNFKGEFTGDQRVQVERPGSPVPSCQSMKSDRSIDSPLNFKEGFTGDQRVQMERFGLPVPSCQSVKSGRSIDPSLNFKGEFTGDQRIDSARRSLCFNKKSFEDPYFCRQSFLGTVKKLKKNEKLECFLSHLGQDCLECSEIVSGDPSVLDKFKKLKESFKSGLIDYPECSKRGKVDPEVMDIVEKMLEACGSERSVRITEHIQRNMNQKDLANFPRRDKLNNESMKQAQQELKNHLRRKSEYLFEAKQSSPACLNEIYTELCIMKGGSGGINYEHEVRLIKSPVKRQKSFETAILCNDIFKPLPGQKKPIRTVLTKGIAGIGKMVSVQKFILDWAEGTANQDIYFIFSLTFRDLNLKKDKELSLMQLLQLYSPQLKKIQGIEDDKVKVLFILYGLDECRLPLDFESNEICCDITEVSSVDVLLTNLIRGNLLPSALLWITSRPAAANQIPPECVDLVTEIRGFKNPQKEDYFRKRIGDPEKASRIISHIKSVKSLYIMCHIPVFCWISATVLETMLGRAESGDLPKTLTEMYTHFLLIQTNVKNKKYHSTIETNPKKILVADTEIILKLGQLAFHQLKKGNLIFCKEDLMESGIDVSEASVYSGVCTEIFKEECGLHQEKVYCFVHVSIQEYLAALFVFHSCVTENRNVLREEESWPHTNREQLHELYKTALDQALESKNGHLDLFVRFLLGLSLDSNQILLRNLMTRTRDMSPVSSPLIKQDRSRSIEKTAQYMKKKIRRESSAERIINLFYCLSELNDNSLVEEIRNSLSSGTLSDEELDPSQCSALAFVLRTSENIVDEFDLKTYNTCTAGQERLIPVVRNSRKAILNSCDFTQTSFEIVISTLQSTKSPLRDLDLSYNDLGVSGVELLCAGLMSPNCKLQRLGLGWCDLTEGSCDFLASVLRSPHSKLRDLELRDNDLQDSGVKALSAGLEDPHCKLHRLGLSGCRVTQRGFDSLASALSSNPSHLRELDLRYNHPGDSGVRALSAAKPDTLTLLVDNGGENKTKPGPRKYGCELTLDPNTAHRELTLSEGNRRVTHTPGREEPYPDHPERFEDVRQVLCRESACERCYWEAEFSVFERGGRVYMAVTDEGIDRKAGSKSEFGQNKNSWSLECSKSSFSVFHNQKQTCIPSDPIPYRRAGSVVHDEGRTASVYRVGVYVDRLASTLSFYSVSDSDTPTLLHRFHTQFTQHTHLCAGFGVWKSSVSLCQLE